MREGIGTITCGKCEEKIVVIWHGDKYKLRCPRCNTRQTVTNVRLKNFKPFIKNREERW